MISWLRSLIVDYGFVNVIIMLLTIVITNLIKKPIKNKAQKLTETAKTLFDIELDKSVITSNIVYIPIGVAFILYFGYTLIVENFVFANLDWSSLVSNSLVYGMLSVSLFDMVKSKMTSYKSKDVYEEVKKKLSELDKAEKEVVEETVEHDLLMKINKNEEESK